MKQDGSENKKIEKSVLILLIASFVMAVWLVIVMIVCSDYINSYMEEQASYQVETLAKNQWEIFDAEINELMVVSGTINAMDHSSLFDLLDVMNECSADGTFGILAKDKSSTYGLAGMQDDIMDSIISQLEKNYYAIAFVTDEKLYFAVSFPGEDMKDYILCEEYSSENATAKFNISGYSGFCRTVVIDGDYNTVFGYETWKLSRNSFFGDSIYKNKLSTLAHRIEEASSASVLVRQKGMVVSIATIPNTDYYLLGMLPIDVVNDAPKKMYVFMGSLIVSMVLLLGVLLWFLIRADKRLRDNKDLREAKALAEHANNAKGEFLAHMSHEIRTPINVIMGMNEMIQRESDNKEIAAYSNNIKSAAQGLLASVNDILDLTKIESGKIELDCNEYSLSVILDQVIKMVGVQAEKKGLDLYVETEEGLPDRMLGDEVHIRHILMNVLGNAVKFTNEGSVKLYVGGTYINDEDIEMRFVVSDTGIGIKQEDISKLFNEFERVDMEFNKTIQGIGLGLTITKKYLDLMNGVITVESAYGKGSDFTIRIPQKVMGMDTMTGRNGKVEDYQKIGQGDEKKAFIYAPDARVLAVDDNDMNLLVVRSLLKGTGIDVETAASGKECLEKLEKEEFDLIFLDHMMPEMDGIETFRLIKKMENNTNSDIPIIALTANAVTGARDMYLDEGFTDYISKPIEEPLMVQILKQYLPSGKIELSE